MLMKILTSKTILGIVERHGATIIGSYLVTHGLATDGQWQAITGGALALYGVICSIVQKWPTIKTELQGIVTTVTTTK